MIKKAMCIMMSTVMMLTTASYCNDSANNVSNSVRDYTVTETSLENGEELNRHSVGENNSDAYNVRRCKCCR